MTKVKVTALQTFSHGNVDAHQGGTYSLNKGDAQELEKAGFVSLIAEGEVEQTQVDQPAQTKQAGDIVVDAPGDDDDVLGDKAAPARSNKMAEAPDNKAPAKRK